MIEFYKYITGGIAEYLLFLLVFLVSVGAFIGICKNIIECIGEQVVKVVMASKSQVVFKVNSPEDSKD
jgi:hypothetical protein